MCFLNNGQILKWVLSALQYILNTFEPLTNSPTTFRLINKNVFLLAPDFVGRKITQIAFGKGFISLF